MNDHDPTRSAASALDELLAHRARFVSFVRSQIGDRAAAEDVVQGALAQLVAEPRHLTGQDLVRWFYRVLRNAIVDRHRRQAAESRGVARWQVDPTTHQPAEPPRRLCGCVNAALNGLPAKSRAILEAIELAGMTPAGYAKAEGISASNSSVRLHRARRLLAERLTGICGTCTLDGCSDCDCGPP
jgi:RNA polymerase sigma-70 factor (ECF subfamily)